VYLEFLAHFPDSHVARKHAGDRAAVSDEAGLLVQALGRASDPAQKMPLEAFDRQLKQVHQSGHSADMTVATLVAMAWRIRW